MKRAGLVFSLLVGGLASFARTQETSPAALVARYLEAKEYAERNQLQEALQEQGPAAATAILQALAEDRKVDERRQLVGLLTRIKAPGVARSLGELVRNETDSSMRSQAITGLADQGDEGCAVLEDLLGDVDASFRPRVAESLVRLGHPQVTDILVQALRKDLREARGTDLIRILVHHDAEAAIGVLPKLLGQASEINQARMVLHLANLLPHVPESRRKPVEGALKSARGRLVRSLGTAQSLELRETARALGVLGDRIAVRGLRDLYEERPDETILWALALLDPEGSRDLFLAALEGAEVGGRNALAPTALRGLARCEDPGLVPTFLQWLKCGEVEPAKAAVEGLVRLDAREAAPELAEVLLRGAPEAALKTALLEALVALPDEEVLYPLSRSVGEESGANRSLALRALCAIPGPAATSELIRLAGDEKVQGSDRTTVLRALATRSGAGIPALLAAGARATSTEAGVREAMHQPEARMHTRGLLALLAESTEAEAVALCHLLGDLGDPAACAALEGHLEATSPGLFLAALAAWAQCGPERTLPDQGLATLYLPRLEQLSRRTDLTLASRQQATRLVARLDPGAGRARMRELLASAEPDLSSLALDLLAQVGVTPEDGPLLLAAVRDAVELPDLRLLDALLSLADPELDDAVLERLRDLGPGGALAAEIYALRCGETTTPRELEEALAGSFPGFRDPDHARHWQAFRAGGWLTGEPPASGSCKHPGVASSYYEIKGLAVQLPFLPPNWRLERWVADHQDELKDDATFAAAIRSPRPEGLLKGYLRKYPDGRHAEDASRRLAERDGAP